MFASSSGMHVMIVESHRIVPCSTSRAAVAAVNDFAQEPISKRCFSVAHSPDPADVDAAEAALQQLIGDTRDAPVYIRADANATHQAVVTAREACDAATLQRLEGIANADATGHRPGLPRLGT